MRRERHYEDEALVTMLASGAGASDGHLAACTECSEKLDSFRCVTDVLREAATWNQREVSDAPNAATIAALRSFAETMAAEDTAAEALLAALLAGPRETWTATLAAHPEYRTPGTVRRLLAATDKALDTMPADAVEITGLAVEIAEHLDPAAHRATTVATLRGQAWRERAYALFYTGQFAEAEKAVSTAERCFAGCVVDEYELARVGIVRAVVERGLEKFADAAAAARTSFNHFSAFGDATRAVAARVADAQQKFSIGEFATAFEELSSLEQELRFTASAQTHALLLANLGYCAWKLGRAGEAIQFHEMAASILADIGREPDRIRAHWNIAVILASNGHLDAALERLDGIHEQFVQLGMAGAACDVALDIAELLVERGSYAEAETLCHAAMRYVESAGLAHTAPALMALGIMHEAVVSRTATRTVVKKIRDYVRRLPQEPALLFAPPPV